MVGIRNVYDGSEQGAGQENPLKFYFCQTQYPSINGRVFSPTVTPVQNGDLGALLIAEAEARRLGPVSEVPLSAK